MSTTVSSQVRMNWDTDWDAEALRQPEARRAVEQAAELAAGLARRLAPVLSGAYRDSIHAEVDIRSGKPVGMVIADDFKANWIERGARSPTATTPARHPLQRGVEGTGVKVGPGTGL